MSETPRDPEQPEEPESAPEASSYPAAPEPPGYGSVSQPDAPSEAPSYGAPQQPSYGSGPVPPAPADGYGQAPLPPSAYPNPQQGGFPPTPPPQQGQYGPPGPGYGGVPPAGPGYGSPAGSYGGAPGYAVTSPQATDSLSSGWERFKANPWPFVLAQLAWGAIFLVPTLIMVIIAAAAGAFATPSFNPDTGEYEGGSGLLGALGFFGIALMVLVYIALAVIQMGAFASATLKAVDGGQVSFGDFFKVRNFTQLLLLALLIGIASAVLAITFVGPLIVLFFGVWSIFFVVDRNQGAIDAVKSSFGFASKNAGQSIVLILLAYVLNLIGGLLCGIGTLITNPLTLLGYADFYRRITGPATPTGYPQAPQYG